MSIHAMRDNYLREVQEQRNDDKGSISFSNPFGNGEYYFQQPRSCEEPQNIQLSSSAPDVATGRTSDVEYPFWLRDPSKAGPFDPKAYAGAGRSYSLANIRPESCHRRNSSITIIPPKMPHHRTSTGSDMKRKSDLERIRDSSPPPSRFQHHVAFGNLDSVETTKNNTIGLTLQTRHKAFHLHKLSRTFMVGVDDREYSHDALSWLLDSMVEDGDMVVCVKVNEKEVKPSSETAYRKEARELLNWIESQNIHNKGIHITLEYSFGKLTQTFRGLIEVHQPGMLVVGTKGKAAQGIQGVWNSRNSFSKYCLQYSPVPVVVVRPKDKRVKKKEKRSNDPGRRGYRGMLQSNGGMHEIDMDLDEMQKLMETANTADEEAHHVARALGLPASFDPLIKGIDPNAFLRGRASAANSRPGSSSGHATTMTGLSPMDIKTAHNTAAAASSGQRITIATPPAVMRSRTGSGSAAAPAAATSGAGGATNASDEDDSDGVDSEMDTPRPAATQIQNREKLHRMEVGEAAALRQVAWASDEEE